jgi:hypothetical protein
MLDTRCDSKFSAQAEIRGWKFRKLTLKAAIVWRSGAVGMTWVRATIPLAPSQTYQRLAFPKWLPTPRCGEKGGLSSAASALRAR